MNLNIVLPEWVYFSYMPLLWLLIGGIATWRITNILQHEDIARPIRTLVGIEHVKPDDEDYWIYPDTFLGKVFYCFWCGSVWIGLIVTGLLFLFPPLLLPFALSALSIALKTWIERETVVVANLWEEQAEDHNEEESDGSDS